MSEQDEATKTFEAGCGVVYLLGLPIWVTYSGWALSTLWLWFAVPLGLAPIGIAQAVGLGLITTFATARPVKLLDKASQLLMFEVFTPGMFVFVGWVVKHFL